LLKSACACHTSDQRFLAQPLVAVLAPSILVSARHVRSIHVPLEVMRLNEQLQQVHK
jgi:hypothetical protein